jgi:hypothetical protein
MRFGHYEFIVLLFGLINFPGVFMMIYLDKFVLMDTKAFFAISFTNSKVTWDTGSSDHFVMEHSNGKSFDYKSSHPVLRFPCIQNEFIFHTLAKKGGVG